EMPMLDKNSIVLGEEAQSFLEEKGPEETMKLLGKQLVEGVSGAAYADLFNQYYEGNLSKKNILDRYDEMIVLSEDVCLGMVKLGEYYTPDIITEAYPENGNFTIISQATILELAGKFAEGCYDYKIAEKKLWNEFFYFVKDNLDIGRKAAEGQGFVAEEEPPVDEIEATLRMLIAADMKARRR
ncbi:MAG: hypothetical protein MJ050_06755, partial [Phascolarctobacterium sp.]|nr:hypothetical protein [Phascolarctobacterium sp.]